MNSNDITETIRAYFAKEHITMAQVAERLGVTSSAVTNQLNGRPFSLKMARKYAQEWGFSLDFLLYGEGNLLEADNIPTSPLDSIPLVPFSARGGSLQDYSDGTTEPECERITPPIKGADMAMEVTGDSMAPDYPAGSRVLLKKVNQEAFIEWGECYVLDTVNGPVLKRVMATEDPAIIECRSINPDFTPFRIHTSSIRGWYRVLLMMALK